MTTRPVGRWVMRTALSVVLTDWPPGPGRAIDVDPQILVVDLDVDLLGLGQHRDGRRRGVDAAAALGHRHALDAVDAAFELQPREHALAGDRGDHLLEAADFGRARRDHLDPPALRPRHSAGTCGTGRRRTGPPRRRRCRRGSRASPARSSAASRGSSFSASARSASGSCACMLGQLPPRPSARISGVGIVRSSRSSDVELGAQPPHLARRRGDRLDLGIILGQPDELRRARGRRRDIAFCNSSLRASIAAIRSAEMLGHRRAQPPRPGRSSGDRCCCSPLARSFTAASPRAELVVAEDDRRSARRSRRPSASASSYCP